MSDETYLIASYFAAGALSLGIALAAYAWLRRPAEGITNSLPQEDWKRLIRRIFPLSTILIVLSSSLSVNYYGCEQKKYEEIVKDRSYITKKNTEQLSEALQGVIWSVGLWAAVFAIALRTRGRSST